MPIPKIALHLSEMEPEDKVSFHTALIAAISNHSSTFPAPKPSVAELTTIRNNLSTRLASVNHCKTSLEAEQAGAKAAGAAADAAITQEAAYVENVASGSVETIALTGYDLVQEPTPIGQLAPPEHLSAKFTDVEGQVRLKWKRVHGARSYVVECAADANGPWSQIAACTKVTCTATALTPGTRYWFRVRALGAAGFSGWSDPAMKIAA